MPDKLPIEEERLNEIREICNRNRGEGLFTADYDPLEWVIDVDEVILLIEAVYGKDDDA